MKTIIVAMRDIKANVFLSPSSVHNKMTAIRSFTDQVNDRQSGSLLSRHPNDFSLYQIGEYDDQTGTLTAYNQPVLIIEAAECFEPRPGN